jgi:hypothetical protein
MTIFVCSLLVNCIIHVCVKQDKVHDHLTLKLFQKVTTHFKVEIHLKRYSVT